MHLFNLNRINMIRVNLLLCFIVFLTLISVCHSESVMQMVHQQNYPVERHIIQTKDGYLLKMYRIPNMNEQERDNRKVILLMHGLTSSCEAFLHMGSRKSVAYKLFDAGYDVWIPNARGTFHSRQHITLKPEDPKFWEFSWHEIGVYDLPAAIDYALLQTNQTKLAYVGHSQGVTAIFVLLSVLPEYNDKITIAHVMTPTVMFKYNHPLAPKNMEDVNRLEYFFQRTGMFEMASHKNLNVIHAVARFCMTPSGSRVCRSFVFGFFGPSKEYYDAFLMKVLNHIPAGASYKQFIHYGQIMASGKFQQYHHGTEGNMLLYNSPNPPEYNLSNVRANIHLMYGANDWLTSSENIPPLLNKLNKDVVVAISRINGFNHIDFAYGRNLEVVNRKLLKVLSLYY